MTHPEFDSAGYCETSGIDTPQLSRPAVSIPFAFGGVALAGIFLALIVFLVRDDGNVDRLEFAEAQAAEMLDRLHAANAEIKRLRNDIAAMRPKLLGARTRVRDLELYIEEQKRIHKPDQPNGEAL